MKANAKTTRGVYSENCFDSRIRAALERVKGVSTKERITLYNAIIEVCHQQVEDCCECISAATFLQLHDLFGFGQKRAKRLRDAIQITLDSYARKYDTATICALGRDLKERNIVLVKEDLKV